MTISIFCQIYLFMGCNSQRFLITVNVWYFTLVNHVLYTTVDDKQDARVREPGLLLVHKMIVRRGKMCTMQ